MSTLLSPASLLVTVLLSTIAIAADQCYGLDGLPTTYLPCLKQYSSQKYVACCGAGDLCLSSGVCLYEGARDSRGRLRADGCTDPTLNDSACQPWAKRE